MKTLSAFLCVVTLVVCSAADTAAKPKLKVAADGFPTGQATPEGAACDLSRAFIDRDAPLFTKTCIRPYAGAKEPAEYVKFLAGKVADIKAEAANKKPSPGGPKSIGKVFAARKLSKNGPASFGYAVYNFQEVMFVDVGVFLHDGGHALVRTLVIKDSDGKWYVHPMPSVSPLLCDGLNDESASKKDFLEAYEVRK